MKTLALVISTLFLSGFLLCNSIDMIYTIYNVTDCGFVWWCLVLVFLSIWCFQYLVILKIKENLNENKRPNQGTKKAHY